MAKTRSVSRPNAMAGKCPEFLAEKHEKTFYKLSRRRNAYKNRIILHYSENIDGENVEWVSSQRDGQRDAPELHLNR